MEKAFVGSLRLDTLFHSLLTQMLTQLFLPVQQVITNYLDTLLALLVLKVITALIQPSHQACVSQARMLLALVIMHAALVAQEPIHFIVMLLASNVQLAINAKILQSPQKSVKWELILL
jgi:hypothetical protein